MGHNLLSGGQVDVNEWHVEQTRLRAPVRAFRIVGTGYDLCWVANERYAVDMRR